MPSGWVFRIEIISKKTPYTKEIMEELDELFSESLMIDNHLIEELFGEDIKLFKKKEAKP